MNDLQALFDSNLVFGLLLVAFLIMLNRTWPRWWAGVPFVAAKDAAKALEDKPSTVILDVRGAAEFAGPKGHLPGAVNLPSDQAEQRIKDMEQTAQGLKEEPVLVHCAGEKRAAKVARQLRLAGYSKVTVLQGGFNAWAQAGLPVETGPE